MYALSLDSACPRRALSQSRLSLPRAPALQHRPVAGRDGSAQGCHARGAARSAGEMMRDRIGHCASRCEHIFPVFLRAPWRWRTACRLGPPVLWRRRTFDRRIERCAPAVPQHDRARTSAIPLPAHRPCAAASQQSPAAMVPHGDVGCLVGFRQEGSAPSTQQACLLRSKVHHLCQPRRSSGVQAEVPKLEPQIEFSVGIFSHERVKHLDFTVRRSGAVLRRNLPRTFHQLLLFCSVASPWPTHARGARISRSAPAGLRRDGGQHPPDRS